MPFKDVPPETAQTLLTPFIGLEVPVESVQKDSGLPRYVPAPGAGKDLVKGLRAAINNEGIILQVHLDGAVMTYWPSSEQRRGVSTIDTLTLNVFVVRCDDRKWRISHAPDVQPKDPAMKLAHSFRDGSEKDIAIRKPLEIKKRNAPGL